jgi:poly(3-hydroxyalkanoate) synthetase
MKTPQQHADHIYKEILTFKEYKMQPEQAIETCKLICANMINIGYMIDVRYYKAFNELWSSTLFIFCNSYVTPEQRK